MQTVQLHKPDAYILISAQIRLVITNRVQQFFFIIVLIMVVIIPRLCSRKIFRVPFGRLTMTSRLPSLPGWSPELIN